MTAHRLNKGLARYGDIRSSQGTEHILGLASRTLDLMRAGLTPQACKAVCSLLLPETTAVAVAMTDTEHVLAYEGALAADFPPGSPIHTAGTLEVLKTGKLGMFQSRNEDDNTELPRNMRGGIVVPLNVQDRVCGTIKFYYRSPADINRSQLAIARGFGQLLSTQLSTHELDRQAELTAKAEVKALQAQINPHFLYNTLDSIAWMCERGKNADAVQMVHALARLFRISISKGHELIPIAREIEHAESYLQIQKYRYKNQFTYHFQVDPACNEFLCNKITLQPIIENAITHGLDLLVDEGHIEVEVLQDGGDILFRVTDNGVGMEPEQVQAIFRREPGDRTGIGIKNVNDRLRIYFGEGYGLTIDSVPDEGTTVTVRMPRVKEGGYETK